MSPVATSVHWPSSLMSSRVVGSAGVCFRRGLYSDDLAELKVGMRCTTVFEMSSQSWSRSLLSSSWYIDGIGFTSFMQRVLNMIQYLFGDDSCMVYCAFPKCFVIIFAYLSIDVTIVCTILSTFSVRYEANIELCICHVGWWIKMKSSCSVILFIP